MDELCMQMAYDLEEQRRQDPKGSSRKSVRSPEAIAKLSRKAAVTGSL